MFPASFSVTLDGNLWSFVISISTFYMQFNFLVELPGVNIAHLELWLRLLFYIYNASDPTPWSAQWLPIAIDTDPPTDHEANYTFWSPPPLSAANLFTVRLSHLLLPGGTRSQTPVWATDHLSSSALVHAKLAAWFWYREQYLSEPLLFHAFVHYERALFTRFRKSRQKVHFGWLYDFLGSFLQLPDVSPVCINC